MTLMIHCQRCGQIHLIGDACRSEALFNKNEEKNRKILGFNINNIVKINCKFCYFNSESYLSEVDNAIYCGIGLKLNSKECRKKFKLLPLYEGYKIE